MIKIWKEKMEMIKKLQKNDKNMKRENGHDKKITKKWKKNNNNKMIKKIKNKSRKIATFHFLRNFCTTGSKNNEK